MGIFENFLRGQQAAQAQALNQLKLQQAQQMFPVEQQLQQLALERAQQQLDIGGLEQQALMKELESVEQPEYQQARGEGLEGYVFNPQTGEFSINENMRARLLETQKLADKPTLKVSEISSINKDMTSLTKDARGIKAAASSLAALKETSSPTDQLAAIFKFMKSLDPTSVVREGEQQMARSTGGPADAFIGYVNAIRGEGSLPPDAFSNMVESSKVMANSAIISAREEARSYLDVFTELSPERRANLDKRVPTPFRVAAKPEAPPPAAEQPTVTVGSGRNKRTMTEQQRYEELKSRLGQ